MDIRSKLKSFLQSLKESEDSQVYTPTMELSAEKEEEIIARIVDNVRKYGMKSAALLFFRTYKPMSVYGSQVAPALLGQYFFLLDLFDIQGFNYNAFFMKRDNIDKLIERIERL